MSTARPEEPRYPIQPPQPMHGPMCDRRHDSCRPGMIIQAPGENETRKSWNYGPQKG